MSIVNELFNLEGRRIAIVDDIPENLKLLKNLLEKKGAHVFLFPSGEMALRAFNNQIPDLILLDINMPGLNGYQVCQRLRDGGGALAEVPVIFVSAQDDVESKTAAFIRGGVDYISKPFQAEEVEARVATHLELALKRKQMKQLLDITLTGAVKALFEVLTIYNPAICQNNLKLSQLVKGMCAILGLANSWRYPMATLFHNFAVVPGSAMHEELDDPDAADFSIEMLRHIPGLDSISQILACPEPEFAPGMLWRDSPFPEIGRHLLKVAHAYETMVSMEGKSPEEAIGILHWKSRNYIADMVDALEKVVIDEVSGGTESLRIAQLVPGMILAEDVVTAKGNILLYKGTELSFIVCRSLYNRELRSGDDPIVLPIVVVRRSNLRRFGNYIL